FSCRCSPLCSVGRPGRWSILPRFGLLLYPTAGGPLYGGCPQPKIHGMDERLLLVEDDPSIREVAALGLTRAGFRVSAIADGRQGLAQFRQAPFDVVILDVMLPSLDGFEICREIRK